MQIKPKTLFCAPLLFCATSFTQDTFPSTLLSGSTLPKSTRSPTLSPSKSLARGSGLLVSSSTSSTHSVATSLPLSRNQLFSLSLKRTRLNLKRSRLKRPQLLTNLFGTPLIRLSPPLPLIWLQVFSTMVLLASLVLSHLSLVSSSNGESLLKKKDEKISIYFKIPLARSISYSLSSPPFLLSHFKIIYSAQ